MQPLTAPRTPVEHLAVIAEERPEAQQPHADDAPHIARIDSLVGHLDRARDASDQPSYEAAYRDVFATLDELDAHLRERRFLAGHPQPTRADWWLYAVLVRFDAVFYGLYKCNRQRVQDYDSLGGYVRDLHQLGRLDHTVDFSVIKAHYYQQDEVLNPRLIVPVGEPDLWQPHDRADRTELAAIGTEEARGARAKEGDFVRPQSAHRAFITRDGSSGHPAEPGRYHLYVANNCPWCHRVTLARKIKRLDPIISMDVLFYRRDPERGWQFKPDEPGCTEDTVFGFSHLRDIYEREGSTESSAPVLFDKVSKKIVSNESAEIIRMLNDAFVEHTDAIDLYPPDKRVLIDQLNAWIYTDINNGAYKAGFARTQQAYERGYKRLFAALERLENILADRRFLTGDTLTEADVRLFPTIFRFDHIYFTRFRLNKRMIRDHRHLHRWLRDVYHQEGVAEASNLDHARAGYFGRTGNNFVPVGPDFDFEPALTADELSRFGLR